MAELAQGHEALLSSREIAKAQNTSKDSLQSIEIIHVQSVSSDFVRLLRYMFQQLTSGL